MSRRHAPVRAQRSVIDQCGECRGIFLDRGELEKLFEAEANWNRQHGRRPASSRARQQPATRRAAAARRRPAPARLRRRPRRPPAAPAGHGYPPQPAYGHGQQQHHGYHGHYQRKKQQGLPRRAVRLTRERRGGPLGDAWRSARGPVLAVPSRRAPWQAAPHDARSGSTRRWPRRTTASPRSSPTLDDADLQRPTRCRGWVVADLLFHVLCDAQRALVALASPADGPADVDDVSYWRAFTAGGDDAAGRHAWWARRSAAAFDRPTGVVRIWSDTAPAAVRAAGAADPDGLRHHPGARAARARFRSPP